MDGKGKTKLATVVMEHKRAPYMRSEIVLAGAAAYLAGLLADGYPKIESVAEARDALEYGAYLADAMAEEFLVIDDRIH